jgi:uncharacterized membrane protein
MNYGFFELTLIFFFYAFLGWVIEVVFSAFSEKKFVNCGLLSGPYCPIYGFGVVGVLLLLTPIKNNLPLLFLSSVILTSVLEYAVGFILEKIFCQKWWDYSTYRFNINGYICLYISTFWGVACVAMMYFIEPIIDGAIFCLPNNLRLIIAIILLVAIIADTTMSLVTVLKLRRKFVLLKEISRRMDNISKLIGQNIADSAISLKEFNDKNHKDLDELRANYRAIFEKRIIGYNRIFKAFPLLQLIRPRKDKTNSKTK